MAVPLRELGYSTGCISTMDQISEIRDYDEGFDEFTELFHEHSPTSEDIAHVTMERSAEWIRRHADEDFFLFVWNSGTHSPFRAQQGVEFASEEGKQSIHTSETASPDQVRGLYDETVQENDRQFEKVVDALKETGQYDESLLIVTADHGEVLDEHGRFEITRDWIQSFVKRVIPEDVRKRNRLFESYGWLGHQFCLPYDELLNVPLLLRFPDAEHAGTRVSELVQTIDIAPTILDVLDAPAFGPFQGTSLLPSIRGGEAQNGYVYSTSSVVGNDMLYHSVRDEQYKYVRIDNNLTNTYEFRHWPARSLLTFPLKLGRSEFLFDCNESESTDVKSDNEQTLSRFRAEFDRWRDSNETARESDALSTEYRLDEDAKSRLSDLGYID